MRYIIFDIYHNTKTTHVSSYGMTTIGQGAQRAAISGLVITIILLFFTIILGLTFGYTLQDRISTQLKIMEGEIVTATAIYDKDTTSLHVRVNFKHVLGTGFDRVAVAGLVVGEAWLERDDTPLSTVMKDIKYVASGWESPYSVSCTTWTVEAKSWPPTSPYPSAPTSPSTECTIHVYQRIDDGDAHRDTLSLSDGNRAVLEFVMYGVGEPPDDIIPGVVIEYGVPDRTEITGDANVALYMR